MKITVLSTNVFQMDAETEEDKEFLDSLDVNHHTIHVEKFLRSKVKDENVWTNSGVIFDVSNSSQRALAAKAGRECLSAIRQLAGLLNSDFPDDRIVR